MSDERTCSKCGGSDIDIKYKPHPKTDLGRYGKDWLICTCARCTYRWRDKPLDAPPESNQTSGGEA